MEFNRDNVAGAIYGLALGDTLGYPTEFMSLKQINKVTGKYGVMRLPHRPLFSDDTQMTIAVARALTNARFLSQRELVGSLTNAFINWRRNDEPRAPGLSCMTSIKNLERNRVLKRSWTTAPVLSKGCGANMRVAPAALLPDFHVAMGVSQLQAAVTHAHPIALVATELTALAIRYAAQGTDPIEIPQLLLERAMKRRDSYELFWLGRLSHRWRESPYEYSMRRAWCHIADVLAGVIDLLQRNVIPRDVCAVLGASWTADEALATGLYHAVAYRDNPQLAISMAARTSGDSDSIACIAGAIIGAYAGTAAWPTKWMSAIERRQDIEVTINRIVRFSSDNKWQM